MGVNMLLAIVMDVYSEVKRSVCEGVDVETIWSQSWEIFERWHGNRKGTLLPLQSILDALESEDSRTSVMRTRVRGRFSEAHTITEHLSRLFTVSDFQKVMPDLSHTQAEFILRS